MAAYTLGPDHESAGILIRLLDRAFFILGPFPDAAGDLVQRLCGSELGLISSAIANAEYHDGWAPLSPVIQNGQGSLGDASSIQHKEKAPADCSAGPCRNCCRRDDYGPNARSANSTNRQCRPTLDFLYVSRPNQRRWPLEGF